MKKFFEFIGIIITIIFAILSIWYLLYVINTPANELQGLGFRNFAAEVRETMSNKIHRGNSKQESVESKLEYPFYFTYKGVPYVVLEEGAEAIRITSSKTEPTKVQIATPWVITATLESTQAPTATPWIITATSEPTQVPTATPWIITATSEPTQEPTATPWVITATPEPTMVPPTPKPTDVPPTPKPTDVPPKPTATNVPPSGNINSLKRELSRANVSNEVMPTYDLGKAYDFLRYVDIDGVSQGEVYDVLSDFFINCVAHSFEFSFGSGSLSQTLESAKGSSGRLRLTYNKSNTSLMSNLIYGIGDKIEANKVMINWLNDVTVLNPSNTNERLFVCE